MSEREADAEAIERMRRAYLADTTHTPPPANLSFSERNMWEISGPTRAEVRVLLGRISRLREASGRLAEAENLLSRVSSAFALMGYKDGILADVEDFLVAHDSQISEENPL